MTRITPEFSDNLVYLLCYRRNISSKRQQIGTCCCSGLAYGRIAMANPADIDGNCPPSRRWRVLGIGRNRGAPEHEHGAIGKDHSRDVGPGRTLPSAEPAWPDIQEDLLRLPLVTIGREAIHGRSLRPITAEPDWSRQRAKWEQLKRMAPR